MTTLAHGLQNTYVNGRCRCDSCKQANRQYMAKYRQKDKPTLSVRSRAAGFHVKTDSDGPSRHAQMKALNDTLTGIQVHCKCGASGKANPRLVGKARKVASCAECR